MNGYPQYPPQRTYPHDNGMNMRDMSSEGINFGMTDGQSLDDIVSQNDKVNRRKSMPASAYNNGGGGSNDNNGAMQVGSPDSRRLSMMDFSDTDPTLNDFQFSMQATPTMPNHLMRGGQAFSRTSSGDLPNARDSGADLAINTQFANPGMNFAGVQGPGSAYTSPMNPNVPLDMDMDLASPFPNAMSMGMDMSDPLAMMGADMNMFPASQFQQSMMGSPINQDFGNAMPPPDQNSANLQPMPQFASRSMSATSDMRSGLPTRTNSQEQTSTRSSSRPHSKQQSTPMSAQNQLSGQPVPPQNDPPQTSSSESFADIKFPWNTPPEGFPSTMRSNPHMNTQFKNAYSSTGFDMLGVLMRVATRSNPQIDIGSVDLSCAFVVCDAQETDNPIVYCSENFERLTGYNKHMILGRNCRFLQSPDGRVQSGIKRKYVDDESVLYLKNMIKTRQEAQISLINYRRGGQPFMNLLTMIPISWEAGGETKFFVGFQVDLVEQPGAMMNKNSDGTFRVNYQRGISMPSYVFNPDTHKPPPDNGQTISKDEVSSVLATYGATGDSELTRRVWDKILLENSDDVIFVLSLKGLFLYLSPSSNKILEYDPSELVGTALSSVCHPSDIVPVTRELKETTNGASVNVVFRIRRKKNGYMWFEGHGSLHTEQGKGRKCIILVGRERPVYVLSKMAVRASGGIGENEMWSKLSTSGMFLFVSSNVRQLLDKQPEELVGQSMQVLMRQDSKRNFGRALEMARTGKKAETKHEMMNRRGQVLQAFTTIYPGDAVEGQKPTFIVAQTRLLKHSRSNAAQRPTMQHQQSMASEQSAYSATSIHSGVSPMVTHHTGSGTPHTTASDSRYVSTEGHVATFAGQNGLQIGHQDQSLASDENIFDELKTTRSTSWQYELRQMEKKNRYLAEEVQSLLAAKKKRKRRKGAGQLQKDCANCHTRTTPEWRRGPSGNRDLCNSCGLRWAKQNGRVSPRTSSQQSVSDKSRKSASPRHSQHIVPKVLPENSAQATGPASPKSGEKRTPPHPAIDTHTSKAARTETNASHGYSMDIPPKIEESSEPD